MQIIQAYFVIVSVTCFDKLAYCFGGDVIVSSSLTVSKQVLGRAYLIKFRLGLV